MHGGKSDVRPPIELFRLKIGDKPTENDYFLAGDFRRIGALKALVRVKGFEE
jgi:hypothetical protein